MRRLSHEYVRQAQEALAEGQLAEASRLAQAAISADEGCLNAILVKALVHRLEGNEEQVEMLSDIAETVAPGVDLNAWIDFFSRLAEPRTRRGRPAH